MRIVVLLLFLSFGISSIAQNRKALEIGQMFPSDVGTNVHKITAVRKGKPLLLDLFNGSCVVCFRTLPKVQHLYEMYKDRMDITLVGEEDGSIQTVYSRFEKHFNLGLPVLFDSLLFRHYIISYVPRYLWIDKFGKLVAATDLEAVTTENIERFISGQKPLELIKNQYSRQNRQEFIEQQNQQDSSILFKSTLGFYQGEQPRSYPSKLNFQPGGHTFNAVGVTVQDLYRYAYFGRAWWSCLDSEFSELSPDIIFVDDVDPGITSRSYYYSFFSKYLKDGSFLLHALRKDLSIFFGFDVMTKTQMMPCLKLVVLPGKKQSLISTASVRSLQATFVGFHFKHVLMREVLQQLALTRTGSIPYIDATGVGEKVDVSVDAIMTDLESVRAGLRHAGLDLINSETPLKVIVLKRRNDDAPL